MNARATRRPELTADELQQVKWLLGGVLTLLGVGTVVYMDVDAWTLMFATAAATLTVLLRPTLPARVPPLVHTLAFPAIVAFFAVDLWLKTEVLPAMVRLDMLLLLYRSINYRQRRDDLQIIVLGLFLIVVAGVLTVSLLFALHLLVYTGCALALLLALTLGEGTAGPPRGAAAPGEPPGWAQHAAWRPLLRRVRQVLDWRVLGLGALLFAGVVGVTALLFMAIPRFQLESSMFLDRIITKKARSGFSDVIRFGDVTEIQQDTSVALSVDVSDETQIPSAPYWRMLVLDIYSEGAFRLSRGLRNQEFQAAQTGAFLKGTVRPRPGEPVTWTFFLESGVSRYLPLLGPFESLRFRDVQNAFHAPRLALLALRDEPVSMTAYRVEGFDLAPALPDPVFAQAWRRRSETGARLTVLQAAVPEFKRAADAVALQRALALATGGEILPAAEFARRVSEWLKRNHGYSLSPVMPPGDGDPLVKWLASREPGHCELFAGSFVLLARAAGFPARVVTGFRGGSWNGYSNNFTIRNSDAHAWAEIFDETAGAWLRADPLAVAAAMEADAAQGEAAVAARLDRSWKARLDSLRVFWYRRIVSFDQQSQVETLAAVKDATQGTVRRIRAALQAAGLEFRAWLTAPWDARRLGTIFVPVAAGALLAWWWREFGRDHWRGWRRGRGPRRDDPVRREAGRWLHRLSGYTARDAEWQSAVAELQRVRFGARPTWPPPEKVFRRARLAVRAARRRERAGGGV
jgi:transglutaminase-like putative cysteine protease